MNPVAKARCDNVPKSIADLIHAVYDTRFRIGHDDEGSLRQIAEIYYWNVDLFVNFIWEGSTRWSQDRMMEWL